LLLVFVGIKDAREKDYAGDAFEEAFISAYGQGSEDYYGMGINGLAARWLPDELTKERECVTFDICQFVEVVTVEECSHAMGLSFDVYGKNDEILESSESVVGPIFVGQKVVVEIGTNKGASYIQFMFDQAQCLLQDVPA
jgi:hypothetical protein